MIPVKCIKCSVAGELGQLLLLRCARGGGYHRLLPVETRAKKAA
jgi:hypothetical protein